MSDRVMGKSCVNGYESVWLSRWIRRGSAYGLKAHSNSDAKCYTKTHLPEDDGQLWKESTGSMKLQAKTLNRSLDLFPNLDFRSKDKESSTETDTLQTDKLPLAGSNSSMGLRNLQGEERVETILDMNKEPRIVANGEVAETSSSPTQRMNVEHFVSNTSFPKECKRLRLSPDTNCGSHVKRLKTNASDYSGNETKSMMVVEEGPSVEKMNYFFHRFLKYGTGKNQESSASRNRNLTMREGREVVEPLHPWIQRWCKKKSTETHERRGGQQVNPKRFALQKQFPSIAAMALMGKALRRTKQKHSNLMQFYTPGSSPDLVGGTAVSTPPPGNNATGKVKEGPSGLQASATSMGTVLKQQGELECLVSKFYPKLQYSNWGFPVPIGIQRKLSSSTLQTTKKDWGERSSNRQTSQARERVNYESERSSRPPRGHSYQRNLPEPPPRSLYREVSRKSKEVLETGSSSSKMLQENMDRGDPLQNNLPLIPQEVINEARVELRDYMLQYTKSADPTEREARIERVRQAEEHGEMEETALLMARASVTASLEKQRTDRPEKTPERIPASQRLGPSPHQVSDTTRRKSKEQTTNSQEKLPIALRLGPANPQPLNLEKTSSPQVHNSNERIPASLRLGPLLDPPPEGDQITELEVLKRRPGRPPDRKTQEKAIQDQGTGVKKRRFASKKNSSGRRKIPPSTAAAARLRTKA
ncbi:NmrA domain-containing protein [Hirschfeldia incana]|nr:NmrA domain-containing protein [Hirschfeldia incana]